MYVHMIQFLVCEVIPWALALYFMRSATTFLALRELRSV